MAPALYDRLCRVLSWVCAGFALFGVVLVLGHDSGLLDPWHAAAARRFFAAASYPPAPMPCATSVSASWAPASELDRAVLAGAADRAAAHGFWTFLAGPIGATTTGHFVMLWYCARHALPAGPRWAWWAYVGSVAVWFTLDCASSLAAGASFNVWMVNLPCAVMVALGVGFHLTAVDRD